jgi:hypothetical protein
MARLQKAGRYYSLPNSEGLKCEHPRLEVDNCELSGWSHAAVFLSKGANQTHVHHSYIHHNQRSGLGYGVCLDQSRALVEANRFDFNRHDIAGTGRPETGYEARYNLVGPNAYSHNFDMHGGADRKDGTDVAGDLIQIHHNTFQAANVTSVLIRGRPREQADVHHNVFPQPSADKAVRQTHARGNLTVHDNQFVPPAASARKP